MLTLTLLSLSRGPWLGCTKDKAQETHRLFCLKGVHFGSMAPLDLEWRILMLKSCDFEQELKWKCSAGGAGGGSWAMFVFVLYPSIHLTTWKQSRKNLSETSWSVLGAIRCQFGHRFTGSLDWPADISCLSLDVRPPKSTLSQCKYLLCCHTKGLPAPASFEL